MHTGIKQELPAPLERTRRRFGRWRQAHRRRSRLPETLWAEAVKAVGRYGLHPTAQALGLDYYSLKQRTESATSKSGVERAGVATFVELSCAASMDSSECLLELEAPNGAKMRVRLPRAEALDLIALSQSFWSRYP